MRIGELARRAGVTSETVRFYERRGLLPAPARSPGGQREYGDDELRLLQAIRETQGLGFTLREIEAFVRDARRPGVDAAALVRDRLARRLAGVDDDLTRLRELRERIARAVDEQPCRPERSVGPVGALVRRGADPDVGAGEPLHVVNGDGVARTLERTGLGGTVLPWRDALHEGPLPDLPPPALRRERARFLAACGHGDEAVLEAELRARDGQLLGAAAAGRPIVLWFEHDLYDQLQLLQVLDLLGAEAGGPVQLVQADGELGPLGPDALERLAPGAQPVDEAMRALAAAAWRAVRRDEVEPFLDGADTGALPFLGPALRRLVEERAPLPRSRRQLLAALVGGARRPDELFAASQAREEAPFLGDTWAFRHLQALVADGLAATIGGVLPPAPPRGDRDAFVAAELEPTAAGRRALRSSR